jgi:hypothetical protein
MDQKSIMLYLHRKGVSSVAIWTDLVATLGSDAMNYSSVTRFLREARCPGSNASMTFSEEQRPSDDADEVILLALAEQPFISIHQLSGLTNLSKTKVHRCLTQSLGFRVRHL